MTATAIIAQRGVNTLVLVHRRGLFDQWRERLQSLLGLDPQGIGTIGGGKSKATGKIDVAMLQSVAPDGTRGELLRRYGQVIVDECHHVSADFFGRAGPDCDAGAARQPATGDVHAVRADSACDTLTNQRAAAA